MHLFDRRNQLKSRTIVQGSWNLADLVKDPSGTEFNHLLALTESEVKEFEASRNQLKPDIPESDFLHLLQLSEKISEKISIATGYAHLRYYENTSSNEASALVTKMDKLASDIGNRMLFFDLWFKKDLDEQNARRLINSAPPIYREHLEHKRLVARYAMSEPEEKIINTLEVTGTRALVKIYDKMTTGFEFLFALKKGKKTITKKIEHKEELLALVRSPDYYKREAAYRALLQTYQKNSGVLGEIYQNIVVQWRDEAVSMRGYKSPISVRNIANNLDDTTVDALLAACRHNSVVFQDYFKEKAKMIGLGRGKRLRRYDLYAPISQSAEKKFTYGEAVRTVLETFGDFDPAFQNYAQQVFSQRHVDSELRKGKRDGAFCYTVTPKITPYVLLNFNGMVRDVSTLAHEFGHAIHSMVASDKPITVFHAPLPLAETASVFAEMLLNEKLASKMSKKEQRVLLASQIDDTYATIMRQAYFTLFEIDAHAAIAELNATIDEVSKIYLQNIEEQFGGAVNVSPDFQWEWLYIPHFYHTPFYCYAYSFGNLLVLSLYQQYKLEGKPAFVPKYLKILSAGGSRKPESLLLESGIDISKQEFWQQGFDYISEKIQQLKELS